MGTNLLGDEVCSGLLVLLPPGLDESGSACALGALRQGRAVPSAEALLSLALVRASTPWSVRGMACWAQGCDVASVSDVALHYRLHNAGLWLKMIFDELLKAQLAPMGDVD